MNVDSWLKTAKTKINSLDAELILIDELGEKDRSFLVVHGDIPLTSKQISNLANKIERRRNGEPLAYLTGFREFYGRNFHVSPDVLIPRVESETIIDFAKELEPKKILDAGTGSGCLAISLKLEIPQAEVSAIDVSENALKIAKQNAENLDADIRFLKSNLLENVKGNFDLIVANLPYVDRNWDWISDNLKFEPDLALFAEDDGLDLIKELILQARGRTEYLILESDTSQQEKIIDFAEKNGFSFVKKDNYQTVFRQK